MTQYHGENPALANASTKQRLEDLIARSNRLVTKEALTVLMKAKAPDRAAWLTAEKLVWADTPLTTADARWVRSQALALPSKHARTEEALND